MKILRTQDERFKNLPDYPFEPNYVQVEEESLSIRLHYVDEGDIDADPVLLMHGEPTWSFLYRYMVPMLVEAGYRAIAPDLIGFGKSDKPRALGLILAGSAISAGVYSSKSTLVNQETRKSSIVGSARGHVGTSVNIPCLNQQDRT